MAISHNGCLESLFPESICRGIPIAAESNSGQGGGGLPPLCPACLAFQEVLVKLSGHLAPAGFFSVSLFQIGKSDLSTSRAGSDH